jgi:hypothetical protein
VYCDVDIIMSSNDNEDVDAWRDSCCLKSDFEGYEDGLIESLDLREETGDTKGDENLGLIMSWDLALSHVRETAMGKFLSPKNSCRAAVVDVAFRFVIGRGDTQIMCWFRC